MRERDEPDPNWTRPARKQSHSLPPYANPWTLIKAFDMVARYSFRWYAARDRTIYSLFTVCRCNSIAPMKQRLINCWCSVPQCGKLFGCLFRWEEKVKKMEFCSSSLYYGYFSSLVLFTSSLHIQSPNNPYVSNTWWLESLKVPIAWPSLSMSIVSVNSALYT